MNDKIQEIKTQRQTQDNQWHMTSSPLYLVQKKERDYGFDSNYCDEYVWVEMTSGDSDEVTDPELIQKLEDADNNYPPLIDSTDYEKVYFHDRWEFVTLFFTEKAAREFIEQNKHRAKEMRVYVDSAYRNEELKEIIGFLEDK